MERTIIITIEDSYIDPETERFQTNEEFYETVIDDSSLRSALEDDYDKIEVLSIELR